MARNPEFPEIEGTATSKNTVQLRIVHPNQEKKASSMCEGCPAFQGGLHLGVITDNQISIGKVECSGIGRSFELMGETADLRAERSVGPNQQAFDRVVAEATSCGVEPFSLVETYRPPERRRFGGRKSP